MTSRNYYEVLGLMPFADGVAVDQAYWHLAKTYQTLAVSDPRARRMLDDLNEAYGVLGTPRLREEYDREFVGEATRGRAKRVGPRLRQSRGRSWLPVTLPLWPFGGGGKEPARAEAASADSASGSVARGLPPASLPLRKADVGDLRASTARMLERWRSNAGIQTAAAETRQPDRTLVDIFRSERELESHDDPLTAVMEILRAPREVIDAKTEA
jgi:curved DNA-binding protein CbpA